MQSITNGTDCGSLGDYLAWNASEWETTKDYVRYFEVDVKDLCFYSGTKRLIKLIKKYQADAIHTCTKLNNGHLPKLESDEEHDKFYEFAHMERVYMKTVENKVNPGNPSLRLFDRSISQYTFISATNSFWNIYGDYSFNTSMPYVKEWQIEQSTSTVQVLVSI